MIKKIILLSIFCCLLFSCGKKDDPKYKTMLNNVLIFKV